MKKYLIAFALIIIMWTFGVRVVTSACIDKTEIKSDTTLVEKWDTVHDSLPPGKRRKESEVYQKFLVQFSGQIL